MSRKKSSREERGLREGAAQRRSRGGAESQEGKGRVVLLSSLESG